MNVSAGDLARVVSGCPASGVVIRQIVGCVVRVKSPYMLPSGYPAWTIEPRLSVKFNGKTCHVIGIGDVHLRPLPKLDEDADDSVTLVITAPDSAHA